MALTQRGMYMAAYSSRKFASLMHALRVNREFGQAVDTFGSIDINTMVSRAKDKMSTSAARLSTLEQGLVSLVATRDRLRFVPLNHLVANPLAYGRYPFLAVAKVGNVTCLTRWIQTLNNSIGAYYLSNIMHNLVPTSIRDAWDSVRGLQLNHNLLPKAAPILVHELLLPLLTATLVVTDHWVRLAEWFPERPSNHRPDSAGPLLATVLAWEMQTGPRTDRRKDTPPTGAGMPAPPVPTETEPMPTESGYLDFHHRLTISPQHKVVCAREFGFRRAAEALADYYGLLPTDEYPDITCSTPLFNHQMMRYNATSRQIEVLVDVTDITP
ncbi:hypothetical protein IWQ60_000249 [Tieghemiomyces parasiticus]|uniref:Uncharacterized protein n=1 Tax=Tieghemiomyces parasiticus TaxID=78921 RepID=A0A9W8DZC1_9FUNG|nr:hypothetical protein IWQ60_000249 [Tieghemiomyces parasiticus]